MPTVSGSIYYDPARNANSAVGVTGLADIPVVLQDTATLVRQIVLTAANGIYSFINVPAGNYRIVEAFGRLAACRAPLISAPLCSTPCRSPCCRPSA